MGTALVDPKTQLQGLNALLTKMAPQFKLALARAVPPERFIRVALTAWQRSPDLQKCSPLSIAGSLMQAAQLHLDVDGQLGHAYLVPFWNKKTGQDEAQLIIGYKGLSMLAQRSGRLRGCPEMRAVYDDEIFDFEYGLNPVLIHKPAKGRRDPAKVVAFYAIIEFTDGAKRFDVMSKEDVDAIKARAKSKYGPWVTDYVPMGLKTVLRRLCKLVPLSVEVQRQLAREEMIDAGLDVGPPVLDGDVPELPAPPTKTEELEEQLGGDEPAEEEPRKLAGQKQIAALKAAGRDGADLDAILAELKLPDKLEDLTEGQAEAVLAAIKGRQPGVNHG